MIKITSKLKDVVTTYFNTNHYNSLSENTRRTYWYSLNGICKKNPTMTIKKLTPRVCKRLYNGWCKDVSPSHANENYRILSLLLSYCIEVGVVDKNSMLSVVKSTVGRRGISWTDDQVVSFCDTAFTNFKWRDVGLIALLSYKLNVRPIYLRRLTWEDVDLDEGVVTIFSDTIKLDENLKIMLMDQQEDWGFQKLVFPRFYKGMNKYVPYSHAQVSIIVKRIKVEAGLPDELKLNDLRREK